MTQTTYDRWKLATPPEYALEAEETEREVSSTDTMHDVLKRAGFVVREIALDSTTYRRGTDIAIHWIEAQSVDIWTDDGMQFAHYSPIELWEAIR